MSIELNKESVEQADASSCQGTNCGTTTGDHSSECLAEAAAGQGWELKPGDLCGRDCPIHKILAEQAGGDERAEFERAFTVQEGIYFDDKRGEYRSMNLCAIEASDAQDLNLQLQGWQARAALAQPSPAQAEAERPEVVARVVHSNPVVLGQCGPLNANDELMTVAQHAASVARWAEMFNRVEQQRDAALAEVERLRESKGDPSGSFDRCMKMMYERDENAKRLDAALARVAELEKGTVYVEARQCDECQHVGINDSADGLAACHDCDWTGPEPDEDKCPDCQRENCMAAACPQCGARYVLVASEEIAAPVAQAQHSVPEGWRIERSAERIVVMNMKNGAGYAAARDGESGIAESVLYLLAADLLAAAPGKEVPQAWLDVQAERRRQITAEGWTPDHDDLYCAAELPRAAAAYILSGANDEAPAIWPFSAKWWKPRDARANYMRAGALILAEIERLDRAAAPGKEVGHE